MTAAAPERGVSRSPGLSQFAALTARAVRGYLRRPGNTVFPIVFPLFFALLSTAQFDKTTRLPGFPAVDGFVDFMLAATITQGVMFGAIQAGTDLATDVQGGFLDRLLASPMSRAAVLAANLAGAATFAAVQSAFFIALLVALGATVHGGFAAAVVLVMYGSLIAVAVAGFMSGMALRTGSTEVVQATFPLVFIVLFLSAAFFPSQLMKGWYQAVAERSPVTWMVNAARHLVVAGWTADDAFTALAVPAGAAALTVAFAGHALHKRLEQR